MDQEFKCRHVVVGYFVLKHPQTGLLSYVEMGHLWLIDKDDPIEVNSKIQKLINIGSIFVKVEERFTRLNEKDKEEASRGLVIVSKDLEGISGVPDNLIN